MSEPKVNYIITYPEDVEWKSSTLKAAKECYRDMEERWGYAPTIYKVKKIQGADERGEEDE